MNKKKKSGGMGDNFREAEQIAATYQKYGLRGWEKIIGKLQQH